VLGDPLACLHHRRALNYHRASAPAGIRMLVDVAVIAGEVAAAVDLQHELPEGQAGNMGGGSPPCQRRPSGLSQRELRSTN
jgi:hypothetical protein